MKNIAILFLGLFWYGNAWSQVEMVPRYIYVLHGGVDSIWGQYMFMVQNNSQTETSESFKVVLPAETIDWQAQDGFADNNFKLGSDGGLEFTKIFRPGDNVHTIGFKTSAEGGVAELTLKMPVNISEVSIMTASDIHIEAENATVTKKSGEQRYDKYFFYNVAQGDTIKLKISGISEGRAQFWRFGWIAAGIILISCFLLAYWSRPQKALEN